MAQKPLTVEPKDTITDLQNTLQLRTKERDAARASLAKTKTLFAAMESLLAILERDKSPYDIWMSMPHGEAKAAYYNEHRENILPFANKSPRQRDN